MTAKDAIHTFAVSSPGASSHFAVTTASRKMQTKRSLSFAATLNGGMALSACPAMLQSIATRKKIAASTMSNRSRLAVLRESAAARNSANGTSPEDAVPTPVQVYIHDQC